ncbi:MAG: hypothetical protein JSR82_10180 [Verrucomicrobia bacterium]|nr:hypothetical protein [Verrucomicrobiota bacterium]
MADSPLTPSLLAARCAEIQECSTNVEVGEFERIPEIGMALRMALHIQGCPAVDFESLKLVSIYLLKFPRLVVERIVRLLAEVEFVRLQTEGQTIKTVVPTVPYYNQIYSDLGAYAADRKFTEVEQLALAMTERLAKSPEEKERLFAALGGERAALEGLVEIGKQGGFLWQERARGRVILGNPSYFSENWDVFADHVAGLGSASVGRVLDLVRRYQGWPLALIERDLKIGDREVSAEDARLLRQLAEFGAVKPPCIQTKHAGENQFIFTPVPFGVKLNPIRHDIFERALAIVSAVRQGQLLPEAFRIRSPLAVLSKMRSHKRLGKATQEFTQQYRKLVHMRIAKLVPAGNDYFEFHLIDTETNIEALNIAYDLVATGESQTLGVDTDAINALQMDSQYLESRISRAEMARNKNTVPLSRENQELADQLLLRLAP